MGYTATRLEHENGTLRHANQGQLRRRIPKAVHPAYALGSKAKIRLGGWYNLEWDCSYGLDAAGEKTGAHLVGFGLRDENWCPCTKNKKSFGIRDAHDQAVSSNNLGQYESAAMIYGR